MSFVRETVWLSGQSARFVRLLKTSASVVSLSVMAAAPAYAASYTAGTQAELFSAIDQANADGDASSTITLTGNLALADPGSIPSVTKTLIIDAGGFQLSAPSTMGLDVADGAELTIDGSVQINGTPGSQGALSRMAEARSTWSAARAPPPGSSTTGSGNTVIKDGAAFTLQAAHNGGLPPSVGSGSVTVTGAGTVVTNGVAGVNLGDRGRRDTERRERRERECLGQDDAGSIGKATVAAINVTDDGSLYDGCIDSVRGTSTSRSPMAATSSPTRSASGGGTRC